MSAKYIYDYPGRQADVHWDERLCIHVAECGRAQGELFVNGRQPWCIPDTTSPEAVAEVCERCPSGALTYDDHSGRTEVATRGNSVNVSYNGPLFVRGDLAIDGAAADMPGVRFRAALCRCGLSKNKPFCDNSHLEGGFSDYGAIGESGPGLETTGGPLEVRPLPDGPLLLRGNVTLTASSGRIAWQGQEVALCRCGASQNKPFCDGSHARVGFRSD